MDYIMKLDLKKNQIKQEKFGIMDAQFLLLGEQGISEQKI